MSVHSEIQNILKSKSGNDSIKYYTRGGDPDEKSEFFNRLPDPALDPLELIISAEEESETTDKDEKIYNYLKTTFKNKMVFNKLYCKIFTDLDLKDLKGDEYESFKRK